MEEQICETCKHFHQHYGRQGNKYFKVHCGHCTGIHIKSVRPIKKYVNTTFSEKNKNPDP